MILVSPQKTDENDRGKYLFFWVDLLVSMNKATKALLEKYQVREKPQFPAKPWNLAEEKGRRLLEQLDFCIFLAASFSRAILAVLL